MKSHLLFLFLTLVLVQVLSSCRSSVRVQNDLPKVEGSTSIEPASKSKESSPGQSATPPAGEENMASEAAVAHQCVEAWKVAVQQKDEAKAMEILGKLDRENPNISTVQFMMGQVKDYFKKPKEALAHFRKAQAVNKFSSIQTLRLADSLRRNGEFKEASMHYDRLIKTIEAAIGEYGHDDMAIVLASVRTGKAHCLSAQGEKEKAREMIQKALKGDPDNLQAKELLKNLGG